MLQAGEPLDHILVVSPKSVLPNWQWEFKQWLVECQEQWEIATITAEKGLPEDAENSTAAAKTIWLINYDIVDKFKNELKAVSWDVIVCDEAHFLKNKNAIRTRALLGDFIVGKQQASLTAQRWWFLTGSPLLNNPSELYTLLKHLDPFCRIIPELYTYEAFAGRYSNERQAPWGTTYKGGRNLPEFRQRLKHIRPDCETPLMIRRTKAQVLPDLPPKQHQLLPLWDQDKSVATGELERVQAALNQLSVKIEKRSTPNKMKKKEKSGLEKKTVVELKTLLKKHNLKVSGKKQELIERLKVNGIVASAPQEEEEVKSEENDSTLRDDEEDSLSKTSHSSESIYASAQSALRSQSHGENALYTLLNQLYDATNTTKEDQDSIRGMLAQARHDTALQKLPHAKELIEEAISSHKVVVFAHHRDVQQELKEAFGKSAVGITGGDSLEDRAEAVQRFQTDESVRVFVGSIRAAGTGITLNAASHVIFVELDWSPLVVQQAEDRCHRVGQFSNVLIQYLFFPDTIDDFLSQLLAAKQSTITAAIDEPSGSSQWQFDFGKHSGLSVGDVAGSDPSYLEWLVKSENEEMLVKKPQLSVALKDLGFLRQGVVADAAMEREGEGEVSSSTSTKKTSATTPAPKKNGVRSTPGSYVMTFGKHKGKSLANIPIGYLHWLRMSGATRRNPTMAICLNKHLSERSK